MQLMLTFATGLLLSTAAFAYPQTKEQLVVGTLKMQMTALAIASALIEKPELGRYMRLSKVAEQVIQKLEDSDKGPLHPETGRALRKYGFVFAKAETFLRRVKTAKTAVDIEQILKFAKDIKDALQLNEAIYTYNTQAALDEIVVKINDALSQNPPTQLRKKLEDVKLADIPRVIAKSATGDHSKTYTAAIPLCHKIRTLYDEFYAIPADTSLFDVLLDIQGINEEYIEFAKIEEEVSKEIK